MRYDKNDIKLYFLLKKNIFWLKVESAIALLGLILCLFWSNSFTWILPSCGVFIVILGIAILRFLKDFKKSLLLIEKAINSDPENLIEIVKLKS